jgi:glycine oxidase
MPDLRGLTLAVMGGGAVGLTLAVRAAQGGAATTLFSNDLAVDSASGVAAGMLAPAFEAALDPVSAGHFELLRAARDAWPQMISALDMPDAVLDRSGAVRVGSAADEALLTDLEGRLLTLGAAYERLDAATLHRLQPALSPRLAGAVFTPEDWRLDPLTLLRALQAGFDRSGGRRVTAAVSLDDRGRFVAEGEVVAADVVIVAAGPGALAWGQLIPELAALTPIKGQILTFAADPRAGPVVRAPQGYAVPQPGGAMVGATMEVGRTDIETDAATVERLRSGAVELFPHLMGADFTARAGVRAATVDGLPLVGASTRAGVHLAVGARRNGWLLAPLIADVILEEVRGRVSPHASLMRASRYAPDRTAL